MKLPVEFVSGSNHTNYHHAALHYDNVVKEYSVYKLYDDYDSMHIHAYSDNDMDLQVLNNDIDLQVP